MIDLKCSFCGKEFKRKPSGAKAKNPVCSLICRDKFKVNETIIKIENTIGTKCYPYLFSRYSIDLKSTAFIAEECLGSKHSAKTIASLLKMFGIPIRHGSDAIRTQWVNNEERSKLTSERAKKNLNSKAARDKLREIMKTEEYKNKSSLAKQGKNNPMYGLVEEKCPNYRGKHTKEERAKERKSFLDLRWKKAVFERDNYTCQCCGYDKGHILRAHHLNSWHWDINGRYDINNGITLCKYCHDDFHSKHGYKNNTKYEMKSYLIKFNHIKANVQ